ncbi:P-loop containing nucleoside triphosphate hydrolase protein [Mucidula mucida]|nr:P-loop containing nucleoside triphosphate hydrolase protein [Mucidula mucida]
MSSQEIDTRVIFVGVGGATCSGKTTLAKHLRSILPDSVIIHQDDFAPPQELVPYHPKYKVQDWDAAPGAIDWPRMIEFLRQVKATGVIPEEHYSHDHLNEQKAVPVNSAVKDKWRTEFQRIKEDNLKAGRRVIWGLVDGFLLYWHPEVIKELDVRIFLRVPHDVLKERRHQRHGYHTAVQSDPEGSLWRDPPHYWEQIVWPAFVDAHRDMFVGGDIEHGALTEKVKDALVVDALAQGMAEVMEQCCSVIIRAPANA